MWPQEVDMVYYILGYLSLAFVCMFGWHYFARGARLRDWGGE